MWLLPTKMVSHKCVELAGCLPNFHWHKSSKDLETLGSVDKIDQGFHCLTLAKQHLKNIQEFLSFERGEGGESLYEIHTNNNIPESALFKGKWTNALQQVPSYTVPER